MGYSFGRVSIIPADNTNIERIKAYAAAIKNRLLTQNVSLSETLISQTSTRYIVDLELDDYGIIRIRNGTSSSTYAKVSIDLYDSDGIIVQSASYWSDTLSAATTTNAYYFDMEIITTPLSIIMSKSDGSATGNIDALKTSTIGFVKVKNLMTEQIYTGSVIHNIPSDGLQWSLGVPLYAVVINLDGTLTQLRTYNSIVASNQFATAILYPAIFTGSTYQLLSAYQISNSFNGFYGDENGDKYYCNGTLAFKYE